MIIDSHVHFWNFDPVRDAWITDDMKVIQRDLLPADIEPVLMRNKVSGCIAVQAGQSYTETDFLLALAKNNAFIKGVVGWADFKSVDINERLSGYTGEVKLKGFRHISEGESAGFLIQPDFLSGLKTLHDHGYTYDILIQQHQLQEAIALVDALPHQPFVLDHCGKPNLKQNDIAGWKEHIKIIAQNTNVHCKMSGLLTQCHWQDWNAKEIHDCLDVVFNSFGPGRVLFGSDWPVMLLAGNYGQWLQLVTAYTKQFSTEEKQMIFSKNAERFYKL